MTFTVDPNIPPVITADREAQTVTVAWTGIAADRIYRVNFKHTLTRDDLLDHMAALAGALAELDRRQP